MKKKIIDAGLFVGLLVAVGLLVYLFVFLPKHTQPASIKENAEKMKIGYLPVLVNLPLFVAIENKYFEKYNLKVEAIETQSPNNVIDGIISGSLDGAGVLAYPILFTAEEKYPNEFKIFASGDETQSEYVSAIITKNDSPINKPEDLKGKKIGVYTGLVQILFLKGIIAGMGMDPEKDIEIVQIEPRLQLQALESGQFDALSTVEPYQTIAKSQNLTKTIIENPRVKYIQNPFPSVATPISSKFIKDNPKAVEAYLLAIRDAIDFIKDHPEEAKSYLVKYTPISKEDAQKTNILKFNQFGEENREYIQKNADWMFEQKLLDKRINIFDMFGNVELLQQ